MSKKSTLPTVHRDGRFFETFARLQDKIRDRAHDLFQSREPHEGDEISDWLQAESDVLTDIALKFSEEDDRYVLRGEIPGFSPQEVDIHIDSDMLTIGGTHTTTSKKSTKTGKSEQRSEVSFLRRMTIPGDADTERMDAHVKDGHLEVLLPKNGGAKQ